MATTNPYRIPENDRARSGSLNNKTGSWQGKAEKRPMQVVLIGPSFRYLSGISYYTVRLANALSRKASVRAVLFRHMLPRKLFPGWKRVGQNLTAVTFVEGVDAGELLDWYNPLTWVKAARVSRCADIVILEWWTSSVAHMYLAIQALISRKTPVIIEYHEVVDSLEQSILPVRIYSRVTGRIVRSLATHFVVHSGADRNLVMDVYHIPREKITIIPHALYDQYPVLGKEVARRNLGITEETVILFFGLLRPYKGVKYLIRAFESLPPDVVQSTRLLIVGEAWEDRESLSLAEESPLRDKITIVNRYVADSEVPLFFSAADMLVLPYTRASQSGVAHIAMAYGLPIIATRVGGLVEGMSSYAGAFFITPGSVGELKSEILLRMQGKATYPIPGNLTWDSIGEEWLALCGSLGGNE
ncbi:MAG: glycosyltransferase [Methanolinea sp.]|jgi:glycosyltransferase involved in cell wall biosynthesis|nr:glycosyltransferase [Methanolinea sp.]